MLRSMMQAYVKNSVEAVELYQKAFNADIISEYKNDDGSYMHVELDLYGQVFSLSESIEAESISGNTMQFCLHFGEEEKQRVEEAFKVLEHDSKIIIPLGPSSYSSMMVSFIDKFGINWCLFA